jgi:hypothetical protein
MIGKWLCRLGLHKPRFVWGSPGSYLKCFKDETPDSVRCERCFTNLDPKYEYHIHTLMVPTVTIKRRKK